MYICLGAAASAFTGCAIHDVQSPEVMLEQSLAQLKEQDTYTFQGNTQKSISGITFQEPLGFEGAVQGQEKIIIRHITRGGNQDISGGLSEREQLYVRNHEGWTLQDDKQSTDDVSFFELNPLETVDLILNHVKQAEWDTSMPNTTMQLIKVDLEGEGFRSKLIEELKAQQSRLTVRGQAQSSSQVRQKAEQLLNEANQQLNEMLTSLQVEPQAMVWLDENSKFPSKLQLLTTLKYVRNGQPQTETLTTTYIFSTQT